MARQIEAVTDSVTGVFEPVVRLGVTGLARSGKTVFITSLVANLLDRGRMPQLVANAEGRIEAAYLQPQPDDLVPRFEFERHLAAMTGGAPQWPESTRAISELRVSLRVRPNGLLAGLSGARTPCTWILWITPANGFWILGYWIRALLSGARKYFRGLKLGLRASEFVGLARAVEGAAQLEEPKAQALAEAFTEYFAGGARSGVFGLYAGTVFVARRFGGVAGFDFRAFACGR